MAMLSTRARRFAWDSQTFEKTNTHRTDSGFFEDENEPTQEIQKLKRSAGFKIFADALKRDGCVIVQDFTDDETLQKANEETQSWLQREKASNMSNADTSNNSKPLTKIMQRSPTIREKFFSDDLYQSLCDLILTRESSTWNGEEVTTSVTDPLLSSAITFEMPALATAQALHRDDQFYHASHNPAEEYEIGRDALLGLYVAGSSAFSHGSMRIVPGSHLWGDEKPNISPDSDTEVLELSLEKGQALIMLGSLYHGMGIGSGQASDNRLLHAIFSCAGIYRQEENPFLTYSAEEVKGFSELVQQRLGWRQTEPSLGWVGLKSPQHLLEG